MSQSSNWVTKFVYDENRFKLLELIFKIHFVTIIHVLCVLTYIQTLQRPIIEHVVNSFVRLPLGNKLDLFFEHINDNYKSHEIIP